MHPSFFRSVVCAVVLLSTGPAALASDISLYFFESDSGYGLSPLQAPPPEEIDVWARIRKGFAISDLDNPLVTTQTTWYSARPDYFNRTTTRASRYLYHVVEELEKRNMPTELALLPFIESAFNPQAYSSAKAAGMWQFIPATGEHFNLKQNFFRDERRAVLASTDAALTYLQRLHDMFGDWHLALAAYNWGEGSVRRAMRKAEAAGHPTDFNSLSRYMPAETRNYVPKLQAVKNIVATPDQYNIVLPHVDNQPYFVTINRTRDIDVKIAAQLAELPMEEFKALNPQFNRPVIAGGADTHILLPKSNAQKFKDNLAKWTDALSNWTAHKVTSARERIETLAKKFKTTPEVIREANNIPPRMRLKAGSVVLVPKSADAADKQITMAVANNAQLVMERDVPDGRRASIRVRRGDTLSSLARRHHVSVAQIKSWNNLRKDTLIAGQKLELHLPARAKTKTRVAAKKSAASKQTAKKNTKGTIKAKTAAKTGKDKKS